MSSIAYDVETGTPYTMIKGVPHKLVTETKEDKDGVTVTAKFVPAKTLPNNDKVAQPKANRKDRDYDARLLSKKM